MKRMRLVLFQLLVIGILGSCFWNVGVVRVSAQEECEECRTCCNYQDDCACNETCVTISPPCSMHTAHICKKNASN
jgi:hypothetical protein